jgi:hypothetical protein
MRRVMGKNPEADGPSPNHRSKHPAAVALVTKGGPDERKVCARPRKPDCATLKVIALRSVGKTAHSIITWYLCVYNEGDEVRAEFSCPVGLDGGFFTDFVERIVIVGPDGGDSAPIRRRSGSDSEDGSEFDVPVTRKK